MTLFLKILIVPYVYFMFIGIWFAHTVAKFCFST